MAVSWASRITIFPVHKQDKDFFFKAYTHTGRQTVIKLFKKKIINSIVMEHCLFMGITEPKA